MKLFKLKMLLAAALFAGAGAFAYAEDAPEGETVATAEASFWLGPDEIVVASAEMTFALMPPSISLGETKPIANSAGMTEEEAQAEADKLVILLSDDDIAAGLTTDVLRVKAVPDGDAWKAVVDLKSDFTVEAESVTVADGVVHIGVKEPTAGLYYALKSCDTLDGDYTLVEESIARAEADTALVLTATANDAAYFYKVIASPRIFNHQ